MLSPNSFFSSTSSSCGVTSISISGRSRGVLLWMRRTFITGSI